MKQRQSNLELLRIVACLMVIAVHLINPVIPNFAQSSNQWISLFATSIIAKSGVIIFVLLFGYFSYDKAPNVKKRVKRVLSPYITYWALFTIYLLFTNIASSKIIIVHQISTLFNSISENYFGQVWYIYILTILILFSPYINKLIDNLNKKEHRRLIVVLFIIFSVLPTLNRILEYDLFYLFASTNLRYNIPIFLLLYLTGAYIKKYDVKLKKQTSLLAYLGFSSLLFATIMIIQRNHFPYRIIQFITKNNLSYLQQSQTVLQAHVADFELIMYYSSFLLVSTVFLFLFFKELKFKQNKIINYVASLTYGIYLNHLFIRNFLYEKVVNLNSYDSNTIILFLISYVVSIFIVGALVEATRLLSNKGLKFILRKNKSQNTHEKTSLEKPKAS